MPLLTELPKEILLKILDNLSIEDCNNLLNLTKEDIFEGVYQDRISLERYLSNNFANGTRVMKILAETDAYLIGPNATLYAFPYTILTKYNQLLSTVHSRFTWSFYLMKDNKKVQHFMKKMESIGVVWQTILDNFIQMMERTQSFSISKYQLYTIFNIFDITKQVEEVQNVMKYIKYQISLLDYTKWDQVTFIYDKPNDQFIITPVKLDLLANAARLSFYSLYKMPNNIQGYIYFNNNKLPIEIMLNIYRQGRPDIIRVLIDKYKNSSDCCFITGFGFTHMFNKLTWHNKVWNWEPDDMSDGYLGRLDVDSRGAHSYRNTMHDESIYIKQNKATNWSVKYWETAQTRLCDISWINDFSTVYSLIINTNFIAPGLSRNKYILFRDSLLPSNVDFNYLNLHTSAHWE